MASCDSRRLIIARFVHLTDARLSARIRKAGLSAPSGRYGDGFVYCVPVTSDFLQTFQWGRELRGSGYRTSVAVVFVVPDGEIVRVGRFGTPGVEMTAAEAVAHFASPTDTLGHQVLIARKIGSKEIRSIRAAPSIVGWRYYPEAKGQVPVWSLSGTIKGRKRMARLEARNPWA